MLSLTTACLNSPSGILTCCGHFKELISVNFDVEDTAFSTGEVDLILDGGQPPPQNDPDDAIHETDVEGPPVSIPGDLWILGRHRLVLRQRPARGDL